MVQPRGLLVSPLVIMSSVKNGPGSIFGNRKDFRYTRLGDAQVQNVKQSNVYVFGDDDVCDDEIVEYEMDKIRSRKEPRNHDVPKEEGSLFVERKITDDDTLQTLSLQYGCPVAELKRVNNLIRDQDFFALMKVKIPVKQHSFLIDQIEADSKIIDKKNHKDALKGSSVSNGAVFIDSEDESRFSYESESDLTTDLSDPETQRHVIREISINSATRSQSREAKKFLHNMDKDLSKIRSSTRTDRHSLDEVISVLTNKSVNPLIQYDKPKVNKHTDCSIKWRTSIILLLVVAIVVPLVFGLLYYLAKND